MCRRSHDYIPAVAHGCVGEETRRSLDSAAATGNAHHHECFFFFFYFFSFFPFCRKINYTHSPQVEKKNPAVAGGGGGFISKDTPHDSPTLRELRPRGGGVVWNTDVAAVRGVGGRWRGVGRAAVYIAVTRRYSKWRIQRGTSPLRRGGKDY